jgi:hypothetical protein
MTRTRPAVQLHIERLVLDGFPPGSAGSAARVADGVERELTRLLAAKVPDGLVRGAPGERLRGPSVRRASGVPERLGERVAASVYRSFTRRSER